MIGVYKFTNKINNKGYIGQSIDIKKRYEAHIKSKDDLYFHRALRKYGLDVFNFQVLIECSAEDLNFWEKFFIKMYDTANPEYGYNLTFGGHEGKPTEETRKKMSEVHKGQQPWNKDKHLSEEHKKKIGEGHKGQQSWNKDQHTPEETRKKISESMKGKQTWCKGKPRTENTKKKISEANKGKPTWNKGKSSWNKGKPSTIKGKHRVWNDEHTAFHFE